jgi:hypothetical protein
VGASVREREFQLCRSRKSCARTRHERFVNVCQLSGRVIGGVEALRWIHLWKSHDDAFELLRRASRVNGQRRYRALRRNRSERRVPSLLRRFVTSVGANARVQIEELGNPPSNAPSSFIFFLPRRTKQKLNPVAAVSRRRRSIL